MKYVQRHQNNPNGQGHRSGVFIVNFEHISQSSSASIVNFNHINADWERLSSAWKEKNDLGIITLI